MRTQYPPFSLPGLAWALGVGLLFALGGCSSQWRPSAHTVVLRDGLPPAPVDVSQVPDAIPEPVVVTQAGNRSPYVVLGQTYHVDFETRDFSQTGYASWYGHKFHGNKTANGEVYDMFAMTAAHKTLAIPAYVRVTHLGNGRSVVVRVNDRGPFHDDRIIDLSYAAASRLGFMEQGTARVRIEVVAPPQADGIAESSVTGGLQPISSVGTLKPDAVVAGRAYLQLGAFRQASSAHALKARLPDPMDQRAHVRTDQSLYKVLVGPVVDAIDLVDLRKTLLDAEFGDPMLVELD